MPSSAPDISWYITVTFQKQENTVIATHDCPGRQGGISNSGSWTCASSSQKFIFICGELPILLAAGSIDTLDGVGENPTAGIIWAQDSQDGRLLGIASTVTAYSWGPWGFFRCSSTQPHNSITKQRGLLLTLLQCIQRKSRDRFERCSGWDWQLLSGGLLPERKHHSEGWFSLQY